MKVNSIMYHDVVADGDYEASGFPGADADLYKLTVDDFDRHLNALEGLTTEAPINVNDLAESSGPTDPWILTFDDGGVSAHTLIADRLEKYGWRGHFLITTDYIGEPSFVGSDQIRDLHSRGHIVGTHSCSHPMRMSACSRERLLKEWRDSISKLSEIIGEQVQVGSVPGGHFSNRVAEAAAEVGMKALFTSEPTSTCWFVNGCLLLGRYTIQKWMSGQVAAGLASGRLAPRLRQSVLWNAKKVTKKIGGDYYLKVRNAMIGGGRTG